MAVTVVVRGEACTVVVLVEVDVGTGGIDTLVTVVVCIETTVCCPGVRVVPRTTAPASSPSAVAATAIGSGERRTEAAGAGVGCGGTAGTGRLRGTAASVGAEGSG